jgi:hypothetical protein
VHRGFSDASNLGACTTTGGSTRRTPQPHTTVTPAGSEPAGATGSSALHVSRV